MIEDSYEDKDIYSGLLSERRDFVMTKEAQAEEWGDYVLFSSPEMKAKWLLYEKYSIYSNRQ